MKINNMEVKFFLEKNKIYHLGFKSSTGKTYLVKLFKSYCSIPMNKDRVLILTFDGELSMNDYIRKIREFNGSLIFIDRFDLFFSMDIVKELEDKEATIFVDIKDYTKINLMKIQLAEIIIKENCIEVHQL